ncbi:MAG: MarR family transcriptional regulator [Nitrosotalea sp.]
MNRGKTGTMRMTPTEIKCLTMIIEKGTPHLSDLRRQSNSPPSVLSRVISSLEENGFIKTVKEGLSKTVTLSESKHALLFRDMVLESRHMPYDKILSGSSLEVLSTINSLNPKSRKDIQENSNVSEPSVARTLKKLKQLGLVQKKESMYIISSRLQMLKDFVNESRHYTNQQISRKFSNDAVIIWERNDEFIIESSKESEQDHFLLTGPSLFGKFSIPLIMQVSYYFYSTHYKNVRLEDALVHSLLIPYSQRNMLAVLLVVKKNEKIIKTKYLLEQSKKYKITHMVEAILDYLHTEGMREEEYLPSWRDFKSKALEYGLKV